MLINKNVNHAVLLVLSAVFKEVDLQDWSFSKKGMAIMFIELLNIIQPLLVSSVELFQTPAMVSAKHGQFCAKEQTSGLVVSVRSVIWLVLTSHLSGFEEVDR